MKVTHCLVYYSEDYKGGIQRYVENVAREQKDMDVDILTTSAFDNGRAGSRIHRVKSYGILFRTPLAPVYVSRAGSLDSDLIHLHSPSPLIDLSGTRLERKYVVSVHNTFPSERGLDSLFIRLARRLLIENLKGADRVIVYNKERLCDLIKDETALKRVLDKTVEIPPGIDKNKYRNLHLERNDDVLFVAHVRPEKGLHVLIDSFDRVRNKDARLVILAKVKYFNNYFNELVKTAKARFGDRVVILKDPSDEQIVNWYNTCGCVVCPSIALESWNFVLMEAAACGVSMVRSDLPAMNWLPESCCEVAKANDPSDLAEKIDSALNNKEQAGINAQKEVAKYDWAKTAGMLAGIYREVLA